MRWTSKLASGSRLADTAEHVLDTLHAGLGDAPAQLVCAFVSPGWQEDPSELPLRVRQHFPDAAVIGCTAGGVIGGGREVEQRPAVAMCAASLPGAVLRPFHLGTSEMLTALASPYSLHGVVGIPEAELPSLVLVPDPFSCDAERLVEVLDAAYPASPKVGGLASGSRRAGGNALFLGDSTFHDGAVGLAIGGDVELVPVVAQGCRPVGPLMTVTRSQANVAIELDGEPATRALERLHKGLSEEDRELMKDSLYFGIVADEGAKEPGPGDFLVRNLVGLDPRRGVLAVGALLQEGQHARFHLRDARTSAEDLRALLRREKRAGASAPSGALLFSCLGRGVGLYGEPDHDSRLFAEEYGDIALAGFFCSGEIGPVHGRTFLHGYTSSFGLFRAKEEARAGAADESGG